MTDAWDSDRALSLTTPPPVSHTQAALAVAALVAVPRAPVAPPPSASPAAPLWTRNMTAAELAEAR